MRIYLLIIFFTVSQYSNAQKFDTLRGFSKITAKSTNGRSERVFSFEGGKYLTKVEQLRNDTLHTYFEYEYDLEGNLSRETYTSFIYKYDTTLKDHIGGFESGTYDQKFLKYDSLNRLVFEIQFSCLEGDCTEMDRSEFVHDDKGRVLEEIRYDNFRGYQGTFAPNSMTIIDTLYAKTSQSLYRKIFEYSEKVIRQTFIVNGDTTGYQSSLLNHDNQITKSVWFNEKSDTLQVEDCKYQQGKLVQLIISNNFYENWWGGTRDIAAADSIAYSYNSDGNISTSTTFYQGQILGVVEYVYQKIAP